MSMEGSLPLITFSDTDEVVSMAEVDHGIDVHFEGHVQEVRDEQEWVTILLSYFVESMKINAEAESSIFFCR